MRSKHLIVLMSMSLFLTSACSANQTDNEGSPGNTVVPPIVNAPAGTGAEKTAPNPTVDKAVPTDKEKPQAREGETQPAESNQARPPAPPCEGVAADAVSPEVQKLLGCKVIQILAAKPDRVQSFKVKPKPDETVPEDKRLGKYPIEPNGEGAKLTDEQVKELRKLIFSDKSYVFGAEKRCQFSPDMGLHFVRGQEAVDILFSFDCDLWLFVHKKDEKLEDFDPIKKPLKELRKSLFPENSTPTQN